MSNQNYETTQLTEQEIAACIEHFPELAGDGEDFKYGDGQQLINCPNPDHPDENPSFSVNYDEGVGHCHSCEFGGNFLQLIAEADGFGGVSEVREELGISKRKRTVNMFDDVDTADTASEPPSLPTLRDSDKLAAISAEGFDPSDIRHGYRARFDADGADVGGKRIYPDKAPMWFRRDTDGELAAGSPSKPWPLYGTPTLRKDSPVLFVEGERCAALAAGLTGWPAVTGGSSSDWAHCNLDVLRGRVVIVWPDSDKAGRKMLKLVERLHEVGAVEVWLAPIVGEPVDRDGLDIADLVLEAGGGEKYAPDEPDAAVEAIREHLAAAEKQLTGDELAAFDSAVEHHKAKVKESEKAAKREQTLAEKLEKAKQIVAANAELAEAAAESADRDLVVDNDRATVVGIDSDTREIVLINHRQGGTELTIPQAHGAGGRVLPAIGDVDFFVGLMGMPTHAFNEAGQLKKVKYSLRGGLGDAYIDSCIEHCSLNRLFIDRNMRYWTGAAKVGDSVVYNLNDKVVDSEGNLRSFEPSDLKQLKPSLDGLSHIYDKNAALDYDPAPMRELLDFVKLWRFTSGKFAAERLVGQILFSVFASSAVVDWKPAYSLIGEAGTGKGRLVFKHLLPLVCGLHSRKDKFSEASLYSQSAAKRLVMFCNEVNSDTKKQSWSNESYDEYVTHASDEGLREVMKNNPDEGARVTVVGSPPFSLRNSSNDSRSKRMRRRVVYEHLLESDVFERPGVEAEMGELIKQIGISVASLLIYRTVTGQLGARVKELINDYPKLRGSRPDYKKENLVQAVPQAVACEAAFGWPAETTLDMVAAGAAEAKRQIDEEGTLMWSSAVEAVLHSEISYRGVRYTVATLRSVVQGKRSLLLDSATEFSAAKEAEIASTLLADKGLYINCGGLSIPNAGLKTFCNLIANQMSNPDGFRDALKLAPANAVEFNKVVKAGGKSRKAILITEAICEEYAPVCNCGGECEARPDDDGADRKQPFPGTQAGDRVPMSAADAAGITPQEVSDLRIRLASESK